MASSTTPRSRQAPLSTPALPTPEQLVAAPELAVLAALQHLLDVTTRALVAVHPELLDERSTLRPLDAQALLADKLVRLAARLSDATTRYHAAALVSLQPMDTDDVHF
jgi:hypothetical protein